MSNSGDTLGGNLWFRDEIKRKQSPSRVILQLNLLNYQKLKIKVRNTQKSLNYREYKTTFDQRPLSFGHISCILAAILITIITISDEFFFINIKWAVNKNVYFNTTTIILLHLKWKQDTLVELSQSGDNLDGHLEFRDESKRKRSPFRVILQSNTLNYHKLKKRDTQKLFNYREYETTKVWSKTLIVWTYSMQFSGHFDYNHDYIRWKLIFINIKWAVNRTVHFITKRFILLHLKGKKNSH